MLGTLPKGHLSCLSSAFRYTPAVSTNIAETFARISRQLREHAAETGHPDSEPALAPSGRPFPPETIERAQRLLRTGGLRSAPRLVHASDL